jgi:hypothetical protein
MKLELLNESDPHALFEHFPESIMTALVDAEVAIDFSLGNRRAVNQQLAAHEEETANFRFGWLHVLALRQLQPSALNFV